MKKLNDGVNNRGDEFSKVRFKNAHKNKGDKKGFDNFFFRKRASAFFFKLSPEFPQTLN